ncbi:hypothetical protein M501DRAFT_997324 [Patellaria atrata CBS 101060]|uniref:Extracellular mutant protein 11 C-terminal domain-containing protein n=1 Tax=Patellaria atrata CBS 101060 TaxID=1346257 RepID=A0A9P4S2Q1_9PEZI|nr:hypothetical protein M501DRAFT_1004128 [Patellaria atrata CBS 101060]KAF2836083.1 hypothetical protein M501DRAFT_997324 [Patellaria atrata CBS 101060]
MAGLSSFINRGGRAGSPSHGQPQQQQQLSSRQQRAQNARVVVPKTHLASPPMSSQVQPRNQGDLQRGITSRNHQSSNQGRPVTYNAEQGQRDTFDTDAESIGDTTTTGNFHLEEQGRFRQNDFENRRQYQGQPDPVNETSSEKEVGDEEDDEEEVDMEDERPISQEQLRTLDQFHDMMRIEQNAQHGYHNETYEDDEQPVDAFAENNSYPSTTSGHPELGPETVYEEPIQQTFRQQDPRQQQVTFQNRQFHRSQPAPPQPSRAFQKLPLNIQSRNISRSATTFQPQNQPLPQPQHQPLPKIKQEPKPQPDPNEPDLDYPPSALKRKPYPTLATEPFDINPNPPPNPLPPAKSTLPLPARLSHLRTSTPEDQSRFLSSLSLAEWEDAGDWFVEQFAETVKKMTAARREKRELERAFEEELTQRDLAVKGKREEIEGAVMRMKGAGTGLLMEGTPKGKRK